MNITLGQMMFWITVAAVILTLGIGFLWLIPYAYVSLAHFYERIRPENAEETATV